MTINELASGYLSLTGRPAATLSVSEYLEFVKIADGKKNEKASTYQGDANVKRKEESVAEAPSKKEPSIPLSPYPEINNAVSLTTQRKQASQPLPPPVNMSSQRLALENSLQKRSEAKSALDLLKSVSG